MGVIGTEISRVEGADKVTGHARYVADFPVSGLTYAALVQSEVAHGEVDPQVLKDCAERALTAPGVLKVLTPLNCAPLNILPVDLTWDLPFERRPPLSDLSVQHVGQHIAIVIAETPEDATFAASLFKLRYHEAPAFLNANDVLQAPPNVDGNNGHVRHGSYLPRNFVKLLEERLQDRRGDELEPEAEVRIDAKFTTDRNAHYPIELSSTIASWHNGVLDIHDATRWIVGERRILAAYLGLPEESVRIQSPLVGGAFGSKGFLWMHVALTAVAAREVGRPVKLVLTREQMFSSTGHRPRTEQEITIAADKNGIIRSTEHHTLTETSTVAHFCEPAGLSTRILYQSPRMVVSHRVARIHAPTPCFMRGPGEAPGLFALEAAMDELAYIISVDPVELRVRNHAAIDQTNGKPWSTKHLLECYSQGAERFGWSQRPFAPRSLHRNGVQVGWGMATATYPGRRMAAGCRVTTSPDGVVEFASATHEVGNGVRTVMTQVATDVTGLLLDRVVFLSGDSNFPGAPYSGASQTTAAVGSAVYQVAQEWQKRVKRLAVQTKASPFHGLDPDQLHLENGALRTEGVSVALEMRELLSLLDSRDLADNLSFSLQSDDGDPERSAFQSFGAHFCEVEVDEAIGRATVTRWVGMFDCGRVLNPKLARNQIMGGITFGLGMALLERVPYDEQTGKLIGEYYLPTHADRPDFDIGFIDTPDYALDPLGVRGIGEIGVCGVAGAISNAIFHATGKRLRDLPITLEDLLMPYTGSEEESR